MPTPSLDRAPITNAAWGKPQRTFVCDVCLVEKKVGAKRSYLTSSGRRALCRACYELVVRV